MRNTQAKFLHYSAEKITFHRERLKVILHFQTYQLCMVVIFVSFLKKNTDFEDRTPQYIIWAENVYTMNS